MSDDQGPAAPIRVRRGALVTFVHVDPIFGTEIVDQGVIVATGGDGEAVTVRPLAPYTFTLDPGTLSPATADDVSPAG